MSAVNDKAVAMSRDELLEYAEECGGDAAYGIVLLLGPDGIVGGWDVYQELLDKFGGAE